MRLRHRLLWLSLFALSSLFPLSRAESTELQPWFGNIYEFRFYADYIYQSYPRLEGKKHLKHGSHDNFLHFGLGFSPKEKVDAEAEIQLANTSHRALFFDYGRLTTRFSLMDDVAGDWISLSTGASLNLVSNTALRNFSTPHQGEIELLLHAAVGKEFSDGPSWVWHPWGMVGFTVANHPHPGLEALLVLERNINNEHVIKVFSSGKLGLGHKDLETTHDFRGYGPVQYRAIDIGAQYEYTFEIWGRVGLAYTYRVLARNYPENNQTVTASYTLPFTFF